MSAEYFLDTNVLVYAFDPENPGKQARARELMADEAPWAISWQVVQEFCSVALHRFERPLDQPYLSDLLELLLVPHCAVYPTPSIWEAALKIRELTRYRFYDSLVVASALESGAPVLYSEDLQHERGIGPLRILNPFR
ncbi:PIN domain-containing protein [Haloferula sp. A504]|uniref:PIN domain-containing protein n=1 Tax=Haloferula sp. A504 TaxID=3373601 RepID=UPI0031BBE13F|nr:PIN domain-containing protein [Verrucomicrobiaceae bacterium E54]